MNVTVIIPTYNRVSDLEKALDSIYEQSKPPKEIVVVDDSDDSETQNLINQIMNDCPDKKSVLKYIRNTKERSLTVARNLGVKSATCEIIIFLDDDIILDDNYIEEIIDVYEKYPDAKGVQGYIKKPYFSKVVNIVNKVFYLSHKDENKSTVLPSVGEISPYPLTKIINCQRLSGANQSYRREIFQGFKFDEKMKGYASMEDMDFSYRIYKSYPSALFTTPHAKLVHKERAFRFPNKSLIFMQTVYRTYFFHKNIPQTLLNKMVFVWSRFGHFALELAVLALKKKPRREWLKIVFLIESYVFTLRHLGEIRKRDLDFLNRKLTPQTKI